MNFKCIYTVSAYNVLYYLKNIFNIFNFTAYKTNNSINIITIAQTETTIQYIILRYFLI